MRRKQSGADGMLPPVDHIDSIVVDLDVLHIIGAGIDITGFAFYILASYTDAVLNWNTI